MLSWKVIALFLIGAASAQIEKAVVDTCRDGKKQSPINIVQQQLILADEMALIGSNYSQFAMSTSLKDKSISVTSGNLAMTDWNGLTSNFVPMQIHFHSPSEHTIDGRQYDLEMHLVHKR